MSVGIVPLRLLHEVWHELWPLIEPAVKRSLDKPDVLARLIARDAQMWAVYESGKPVAAVVTKLQDHKEGRKCLLWLVGGSRLKEWAAQLMDILAAWAREMGCIAIWGAGRKGWARVVPLFGGERIDDVDGRWAWERRIA